MEFDAEKEVRAGYAAGWRKSFPSKQLHASLQPMRILHAVVTAALLAFSPIARAQSTVSPIELGKAAEPLPGPWNFTPGDSPWNAATQSFVWAEPKYDDA